MKRISRPFSLVILVALFCILFVRVVAKGEVEEKYTLEDCKHTVISRANTIIGQVPTKAISNVQVAPSLEDSTKLIVSIKTMPEAYFLKLLGGATTPCDVDITKEMRDIFDKLSVHIVATVQCPQNISDKEEYEQYIRSLFRAEQAIDTYVQRHTNTSTLQNFLRQFFVIFHDANNSFANEVKDKLPFGYSMNIAWDIRERFTDDSFQNLRITIGYCSYFLNKQTTSPEEAEKKGRDCLEKQAKRFEFTVKTEGESAEALSKDLYLKAKQLNTQVYIYLRALVAKEAKESI